MDFTDEFSDEDDQVFEKIDIDKIVREAESSTTTQNQSRTTTTTTTTTTKADHIEPIVIPPSPSSSPEIIYEGVTPRKVQQTPSSNVATLSSSSSSNAASSNRHQQLPIKRDEPGASKPNDDAVSVPKKPLLERLAEIEKFRTQATRSTVFDNKRKLPSSVIYVEGLLYSQMRKYCHLPNFRDELTDEVTHYVFFYHSQTKICHSPELYLALARKIWVVSPAWATEFKMTKKKPLETNYTIDTIASLGMNRKYTAELGDNSKPRLFEKMKFVIDDEYQWNGFHIPKYKLSEIIQAAGGYVVLNIYTEIRNFRSISAYKSTHVLTTMIDKQRVIDHFVQRKWITIHPQFILDCIWNDAVGDVPIHQLFTPAEFLKCE